MKVIRIQIQSLQKGTNCPFLLASTLYLGRKGQILKGKLHLYYKNYFLVVFRSLNFLNFGNFCHKIAIFSQIQKIRHMGLLYTQY